MIELSRSGRVLSLILLLVSFPAAARDEYVTTRHPDGSTIPFVLTYRDGARPTRAMILMPGGSGQLNPRLENGALQFAFKGNFLIRSRELFADQRFGVALSDASTGVPRMIAIVEALEQRWGRIPIFIVGTSRSTETTMSLARPLDGRVAGFVHSSSMNPIASFDTRGFKSRHLIVTHRDDHCRATRPTASEANAKSYGTEIIVMEGGKTQGDDCEAFAHHGYNGIERATVDRIKAWMSR